MSFLKLLNQFCKRCFDFLSSFTVILLIAPILLVIYILVKLDSPGPALYIHQRVGRNGQTFNCFKFRSMKLNCDPNKLAEDEEDHRITKFGKFIREKSIDELPQLFNILLGDMSVVGPRPALPIQVEAFDDVEKDKLLVKPGLTGWTQINGRNSIPYEKRMELDCWYAHNHNIFLDFYIIFKTFRVLFPSKKTLALIYDKDSNSPH